MIYYFTQIINDNLIVNDRDVLFFESARKRSEYLLSTMEEKVEIISLAMPRKKGYFKSKLQKVNSCLFYYYPSSFCFLKLGKISMLINILCYLLNKVKKEDLIVFYNTNNIYFISMIVCKLIKKNKIIFEIEELYSDFFTAKGKKMRITRFREAFMLKYSDAYIVVSQKIREKIKNKNPVLLNFGYDVDTDKVKSFNFNKNIIVYSGRLDYEGGIELFMDALELINETVKVIITGSGHLSEKIEKTKIINDKVTLQFLGFVDEITLNKIMNSATIAINPLRLSNIYSEHSFPSKTLMYLSYGCNVVSSKSNGILPLLDICNNLYTYEEDSPILLAKKIEEVLTVKINKKENLRKINLFFEKQKHELNLFWKLLQTDTKKMCGKHKNEIK